MTRYVVMVRGVDDSFSAYGAFRDLSRAEALVDSFNRKVQAIEAARPDEPDGVAWAYVMTLRKPSLKDATSRAGLPAPANSQTGSR